MSVRVFYLDSSAFVKTILDEPESLELKGFLEQSSQVVSSALLETEVRRAAMRFDPRYLQVAEQRLRFISRIDVTRDILVIAGSLRPIGLRSLDAIHLATALALGAELEVIVTYDVRMAEAATTLGLSVQNPGLSL